MIIQGTATSLYKLGLTQNAELIFDFLRYGIFLQPRLIAVNPIAAELL